MSMGPSKETQRELKEIAQKLMLRGKGILAADESVNGIEERLRKNGIINTEDNRRLYRQLMFSADPQVGQYLSGVIVFDETLYQKDDNGKLLPELLQERGIQIGIKVDKGLVPLFGTNNEMTTQGLDDLANRCKQYKSIGCSFTKWRAVFKVDETLPSAQAIEANINGLAQYAAICQSEGLVPIIEPEILADGTHDLIRSQEVAEAVLSELFRALHHARIYLEGCILKPAMVLPGSKCPIKYSNNDIAIATVEALQRCVPVAVSGIAFLSGGQDDDQALVNLNEINTVPIEKPWPLTFCYGRAIQNSVLQAWVGKAENVKPGQDALLRAAQQCSAASLGTYSGGPRRSSARAVAVRCSCADV